MPTVVQKYGGSSVADVEKLRKVAAKIAATRKAGFDVCVVVSAMGDTTDDLLSLAKEISPDPPRRELDMLLTAGERISMALLAMALHELQVPAISFTGSQSGILTSDAHSTARILEIRPVRVLEELRGGKVVIVAGFQGVSPRKEVTTLGRGGSDTTAVALAAALGADCEIYSDVAGVYTADPRVVPGARRIDELSYEEMQALATAGAKVLNAQAVEFAKEKGIAIRARSTFGGPEETVVRAAPANDRIAGVALEKELALVVASCEFTEKIRAVLHQAGAAATEAEAPDGVALAVPLENVHGWPGLAASLRAAIPGVEILDDGIAAVTVVGTGAGTSARVRHEVVSTLESLGAPARAISADPLRVTAYAEKRVLAEAAREIHRRLLG